MRELAVQAANGTNSASDRAALNAELQQLIKEVDAVSATTTFNGVNLLNGSSKNVSLQIGTRAMDTLSFGIPGVRHQCARPRRLLRARPAPDHGSCRRERADRASPSTT